MQANQFMPTVIVRVRVSIRVRTTFRVSAYLFYLLSVRRSDPQSTFYPLPHYGPSARTDGSAIEQQNARCFAM